MLVARPTIMSARRAATVSVAEECTKVRTKCTTQSIVVHCILSLFWNIFGEPLSHRRRPDKDRETRECAAANNRRICNWSFRFYSIRFLYFGFSLHRMLISDHVFAFTQLWVPIMRTRRAQTQYLVIHMLSMGSTVHRVWIFFLSIGRNHEQNFDWICYSHCLACFVPLIRHGSVTLSRITIATVSIESNSHRNGNHRNRVRFRCRICYNKIIRHQARENKQNHSRKIIGDGRMRKTILAKER